MQQQEKIDALTVASITILVYFLCCFVHEAMGHGGAAVLVGAKVTKITTAYCSQEGASEFGGRVIAAAGILTNLLVGCLALGWRTRRGNNLSGPTHYFLWLFGLMNWFTAGGYLMAFSLQRMGDVNVVVRGLPGEWGIRGLLVIVGLGLTVAAFFYAGRTLTAYAGAEEDRMRRALWLTLFPYLLGGCVNVAVSLLGVGRVPLAIVLISAGGSTFGGNFPLVWTPAQMPKEPASTEPITPTRSWAWIVAGAVGLVGYAILGRGIAFA